MKNHKEAIIIFFALLLMAACSRTYNCITITSCGGFIYHNESENLTCDSVCDDKGNFITKIDCK